MTMPRGGQPDRPNGADAVALYLRGVALPGEGAHQATRCGLHKGLPKRPIWSGEHFAFTNFSYKEWRSVLKVICNCT
jgi:hypothetical protein